MAERPWKVVDDRLLTKGEGVLRREIWVDENGQVVRYNLAYINPLICPLDNGRVLGYDSALGWRHRHCMGQTTAAHFRSCTEIERRAKRCQGLTFESNR